MTTLNYAMADSMTMLRRQVVHLRRYPSMTLMLIGMPVVFLLLFVFVFGGTLGAGIGGGSGDRARYVEYVTPGILLMTIASAAQGTAVSVAMDMTEGIVSRFRTMSISRAAMLTGHVLGSMVQVLISMVIVIGLALVLGFRPTAGPLEWLAAIAMLALMSFAFIWLTVALGMVSKSVETASNLPLPLTLLPFFGSGFVPTDSMPSGLRWFAEYQPFTPMIETLRGLLLGAPTGNSALIAVIWCFGIALVGYLWARKLFDRDPSR